MKIWIKFNELDEFKILCNLKLSKVIIIKIGGNKYNFWYNFVMEWKKMRIVYSNINCVIGMCEWGNT